jgi:hypothetical protein
LGFRYYSRSFVFNNCFVYTIIIFKTGITTHVIQVTHLNLRNNRLGLKNTKFHYALMGHFLT